MTNLKPILPDIYVRVLELIKEDQEPCGCPECDCETLKDKKEKYCSECEYAHRECNEGTCQHISCEFVGIDDYE
jgi:hypothetical protein